MKKEPTRIHDPEILLDELFSLSAKLTENPGLFKTTELPGFLNLFLRSCWESSSTVYIEGVPQKGEACALFAISGNRILYVVARSFAWDARTTCFVVDSKSISMFIGPEIQTASTPTLYLPPSVGADTEVDGEMLAGLLGVMLTEHLYDTNPSLAARSFEAEGL